MRASLRRPERRAVFRWVLRNARARVRDRENLRFERTRVFGRVRRLFVRMGDRLAGQGVLETPRDVFFLELDELLAMAEGGPAPQDIRQRVAARRTEFAGYRAAPAPPDRFLTRGGKRVADAGTAGGGEAARGNGAPDGKGKTDEDARSGVGCCPGQVRAKVRVVFDPRDAHIEPGHILVARRTDPGWILLFPAAAGVLVEHGSLLSHAAIVSRELGIPSVVSIPGLTGWLRDGDEVDMDGATGQVRLLRRGSPEDRHEALPAKPAEAGPTTGGQPRTGDRAKPAAKKANPRMEASGP